MTSKQLAETGTEIITVTQAAEVLLHGGDLGVVNTDDIQDDMVKRILASESLQDAFQAFESTPMKELAGMLLDVKGIAFMRSAFDKGPQIYALLKCTLVESGVDVVASMGGRTTMASFVWAMQHEAMPLRGTFVLSRSNSDPEKSYWSFKLA